MRTAALITYLPSNENREIKTQNNTTTFPAEAGPISESKNEGSTAEMSWSFEFVDIGQIG